MSTMEPVTQVIQSIAQKLCVKYGDEALCTQYAWWVLEAITEQTKSHLLLQSKLALSESQQQTLDLWITKQVEDNIPLQYLIGSVPFADCTILVEPPTLIPRQETEEWVVRIIDQLKNVASPQLRILDLCTGSGCIAIALAKALPSAQIFASDISNEALSLARKNAEHNNIASIQFFSSDLLSDIPSDCTFDIIISNPPYISMQEWKHVDKSVKEWEDPLALLAPEEGLGIVKQVIDQAAAHLKPHAELQEKGIAQLIIEIGYQQGEQTKKLFEKKGFCNVTVQKDLQRNDRIVVGSLPNERHTA